MTTSFTNRFRPSIEALEHREAPTGLKISPPGWIDPGAHQFIAAHAFQSAAADSHARPFHLSESGSAVIDFAEGTVSATATGKATHLGAFTLRDTSRIVGFDGVVLQVAEGQAVLVAGNIDHGDHLYGSFSGSVNLATGTGTLNFEWTGGTGRFANATGATVWHVTLNPGEGLTYTAVAEGVISY